MFGGTYEMALQVLLRRRIHYHHHNQPQLKNKLNPIEYRYRQEDILGQNDDKYALDPLFFLSQRDRGILRVGYNDIKLKQVRE